MKTICFYLNVHQPIRLRTYRFFDIGASDYYFDDYQNRYIVRRMSERSYLPMNNLLMQLIEKYEGKFKLALSISGVTLDLFEKYAPDTLESFKRLVATGCVEIVGETYAHSFASLFKKAEFERQVKLQNQALKKHFGVKPKVFCNSELVYSDEIGAMVADLGFKAVITEGAKHILGWKSPNFVYANALNDKLAVLLRNYSLSEDIVMRFSNKQWSEYPLTAEKYVSWMLATGEGQQCINLCMDYEAFGDHHTADTGIFDFMQALPQQVFNSQQLQFGTPSEVVAQNKPVAAIHVPLPISWIDEERALTRWTVNDLQRDAFDKLYNLQIPLRSKNQTLQEAYMAMQDCSNFYYMNMGNLAVDMTNKYTNPYGSAYQAYINYMNIISDMQIRTGKTRKKD